jgi:Restriction Enzyme Adenine Methylase Associated
MGDNLLNVLWKAHFIDRHVSRTLGELLENDDASLIRLIRKRTPELTASEIRESLKRADIRIDFPVVSVSSQSLAREEAEDEGTSPVEVVEKTKEGQKTLNIPGVKVSDLIRTNLVEPPLKLEKVYKGAHLEAEIQQDGTIVFDGDTYRSLSLAASFARKSIIGAPEGRKYPQTNGWVFWKYYHRETGNLEEIDVLRQRYLNGRSRS